MALTDCVAAITRAAGEVLGTAITQDQVFRILDSVDQRARMRAAERAHMSKEEQINLAAEELGAEAKAAAIIEKANALRNLRKRIARREYYDRAKDPVLGIEARLVGVNTVFGSSRDSVYGTSQALFKWYAGFALELDEKGYTGIVRRGDLDELWGKELFELSR